MLLAFILAQAAAAPPAPDVTAPLHKVVVDAIRNCPKPKGDEIAVCAKDRGYSERYRIEKLQSPMGDPPSVKVDVTAGTGASGVGSCSTVGAGGQTGCQLKADNDWQQWKKDEKAAGRDFPW